MPEFQKDIGHNFKQLNQIETEIKEAKNTNILPKLKMKLDF